MRFANGSAELVKGVKGVFDASGFVSAHGAPAPVALRRRNALAQLRRAG